MGAKSTLEEQYISRWVTFGNDIGVFNHLQGFSLWPTVSILSRWNFDFSNFVRQLTSLVRNED